MREYCNKGFLVVILLGILFISWEQFVPYAVLPKWYWFVYLTSVWGLIAVVSEPPRVVMVALNLLDISVCLFVFYILVRILSSEPVHSLSLCITLTSCNLFFLLRRVGLNTWSIVNKWLIGVGIVLALYGLFQFGYYKELNVGRLFDNPAGYAACLSALYSFLLIKATSCKGRLKTGYVTLLVLHVFAIIITQSRAGLLAVVIASGVFLYGSYYSQLKKYFKRPKLLFAGSALLFIVISFFFNSDSANGRLLVWRVTADIVLKNPVLGGGYAAFIVQYMPYQADFFRSHPENSLSILADNVIYPYNEYIGLLIEYGLIGFILFLMVILLAVLKQKFTSPHVMCLLSIGTFSFFSYPFRYAFILFLLIYCFAALAKDYKLKIGQKALQINAYVLSLFGGITAIACLYLVTKDLCFEYQWGAIVNNTAKQNEIETLKSYHALYDRWNKNPFFLYNYGVKLYELENYTKSISILHQCERYFTDYDVQILLGENYLNLGNLEQAEKHYIEASFMCPNRFIPLYKLVCIYDRWDRIDTGVKAIT